MSEPVNLQTATLGQLLSEQAIAAADLASAKMRVVTVKAELGRRYAESGARLLAEQGKDHGSVTLQLQDGFKAKVERKQTVKWDSAALMAVAQTLPWERVEALFKIDFSMSEKIYAGVSALSPELRAKIDDARTTTIGEPVVTLTKDEA